MENEAERIAKEVERKIARAKELGVDKIITNLYFDKYLRHFPSWIARGDEGGAKAKSLVSGASKVDDETIKITLGETDYKFKFKESSGTGGGGLPYKFGSLELLLYDKTVLRLRLYLDYDEYLHKFDNSWRHVAIEAFIEGGWVNDFTNLKRKIDEQDAIEEKEREEREEIEKHQKLNELKQNFGIE